MTPHDLITLASTFSTHIKRSEQTVARWCGGHGRLFQRLRDGQGCTMRTAEHVVAWFDEHWPADLAWPSDVDRPSLKAAPRRRRAA